MKRTELKRKSPLKARSPMKKSRPKMTKIRASARGEQCLVNVLGVCSYDSSTVVLAHLNGAGMSRKNPDWQGAYCCAECHAWLDGGYAQDVTSEERDLLHLRGVIKTQEKLIEKGLITINQ